MDAPIAIVGMSCRFAEAANPAALWRNVMRRRCSLGPLSSIAALPIGVANLFGSRDYPQAGGSLGSLYACVSADQEFPRQMNAGENQDLYFATQLAFDALADAGMRPHANPPLRGSVHLGYAPPFNSSTVNWLDHTMFIDQTMDIIAKFFPSAPDESLASVRARLTESLPAPDAASFLTGTGHHVAVWIAHQAGFEGPAAIADSGALSCNACFQSAVNALRDGRVDVALVGAVNPPFNRAVLQGLSGIITFSKSGRLVPFDRDADGTLPGEGGAFFVLKRRADALVAHDRIYALIRSLSCAAPIEPSGYRLARLFSETCDRAEVPVKSIGLVEGTGSGEPENDARVVQAVCGLWGDHRPGEPLVGVGSVMGNIGHTMRAAVAAGAVKCALALHHRVLPPQVPADHPLEGIDSEKSGAYLLAEARPWITGDSTSPRRAAVVQQDAEGRASVLVMEEEPEDRT